MKQPFNFFVDSSQQIPNNSSLILSDEDKKNFLYTHYSELDTTKWDNSIKEVLDLVFSGLLTSISFNPADEQVVRHTFGVLSNDFKSNLKGSLFICFETNDSKLFAVSNDIVIDMELGYFNGWNNYNLGLEDERGGIKSHPSAFVVNDAQEDKLESAYFDLAAAAASLIPEVGPVISGVIELLKAMFGGSGPDELSLAVKKIENYILSIEIVNIQANIKAMLLQQQEWLSYSSSGNVSDEYLKQFMEKCYTTLNQNLDASSPFRSSMNELEQLMSDPDKIALYVLGSNLHFMMIRQQLALCQQVGNGDDPKVYISNYRFYTNQYMPAIKSAITKIRQDRLNQVTQPEFHDSTEIGYMGGYTEPYWSFVDNGDSMMYYKDPLTKTLYSVVDQSGNFFKMVANTPGLDVGGTYTSQADATSALSAYYLRLNACFDNLFSMEIKILEIYGQNYISYDEIFYSDPTIVNPMSFDSGKWAQASNGTDCGDCWQLNTEVRYWFSFMKEDSKETLRSRPWSPVDSDSEGWYNFGSWAFPTLINIPTGDASVQSRKIYRQYRRAGIKSEITCVLTIPDNTTTSIMDTQK